MGSTAQNRAVDNYRKRLSRRGLARFEVLGLKQDRELVRALARRLAENDPAAAGIRDSVRVQITPDTRKKGGILEMLRNSPLMGVELNLARRRVPPRRVDL
jgi:hypothetical protein